MSLISELLHSEVVDAEGEALGSVHDVRLVQDGPLVEGFGAALRVDGLVIGNGSLAVRLGFHRHRVQGPALLKAIFVALERRARFAAWEQVASWDGATVVLDCPGDDLPRLTDVY